ncbi:uncharacterized protein LAJ45_05515 [Morchella importuna]|uniref:Post-GPI attachment to proteins factor 3 n=1 Tax=Morchella conica CCBAS932 TaxID=1392247 RepID=A0A3N4L7E8_9PEZI|nr:uncharacterized protein LAJ45_05515 [Morchella importuna]KAH8150304.1 hypothetical protein LAJ45_05515 [Morchella importuna]RPB13915.1 Per1-domain-containing protein [Morchella conica CCBAS932]
MRLFSRAAYVASVALVSLALLLGPANASRGDRLPDFKDCVKKCHSTHCLSDPPTPIPLHLRLLLWSCPSECDYTCQHAVTASRYDAGQPIEQFHGKWPFVRLLGIQEPFSVLFSILNGYAHYRGQQTIRRELPRNYPLVPYYRLFGLFGIVTWFWSTVFHMRDFVFTERMDYFAAGASVLYGLYLAPVRVFRLYKPHHRRLLRVWTCVCVAAYVAHVYYLSFIKWDYGYNMAANVVVGILQNSLWTYFSIKNFSQKKSLWAAGPGLIVTWLVMAMSLELLDFPPLWGCIDAHSLWHAATVMPAVWWYKYLIVDAKRHMGGAVVGGSRFKE